MKTEQHVIGSCAFQQIATNNFISTVVSCLLIFLYNLSNVVLVQLTGLHCAIAAVTLLV